jgi:arginyl-tRNA synthetase
MNVVDHVKSVFFSFVQDHFGIDVQILPTLAFNLNTESVREQFGDMSTNIPFVLAKITNKSPQHIAALIAEEIQDPYIQKIELAGVGFLNIYFTPIALQTLAQEIDTQKEAFFTLDPEVTRLRYSIEFVSANPTGPLHLGHGRGGIIGDVLGNILRFLGHLVTKEFYINDAGSQMQKLGESFKIRCEQLAGFPAQLPEDGYQGEYLITLAEQARKEYGDTLYKNPAEFFIEYPHKHLLSAIEQTLKKYGITYDVWFSEQKLHKNNAIAPVLAALMEKGYIYEKDKALWFKSTAFGDDKDRVVKKSTGEFTYVAADIAYLEDKLERGFDKLFMVLGQDHHSYVVRLKAVMSALGYDPERLDIILYQLVTIKESGATMRLSKRAGRIVTLDDVIEAVDTDVARFFYLNKKADAHLEFDVDLALKKTDENPVYYIQYAYVRTKSILEKVKEQDPETRQALADITVADSIFIGEAEKTLLKKIASLKYLLESIAKNYQTHLLTYYVIELAQTFHSYYNAHKVIDKLNIHQSRGRLLVTLLVQRTLKTCFDILGVSAPEKM